MSHAAPVWRGDLTCGSRAAHVWELTCTAITIWVEGTPHVWLTCVTCSSRVGINVHSNYYMGGGDTSCVCSHVSRAAHVWELTCTAITYMGGGDTSRVGINVHSNYYMGGGDNSHVARICHMQLMCRNVHSNYYMGGGDTSSVCSHVGINVHSNYYMGGGGTPHMWLTCVTCSSHVGINVHSNYYMGGGDTSRVCSRVGINVHSNYYMGGGDTSRVAHMCHVQLTCRNVTML